ncbi:MAG TPA: SRPBCC domain-containing protein [Acidimicrobiales bacterium]|nr:SRPBCC domain-containing protein [Acidimicrobiales bacterium]
MDEQVTRSVDLDAPLEDVWQAVADPAERAQWLDDEDARSRHVRVDDAAPGERLVWTWWRPGDEGDASTVSVVLAPLDGGGTRLVVTERLTPLSASPVTLSAARARIRALWAARLVGLDAHVCVGAAARVAVA